MRYATKRWALPKRGQKLLREGRAVEKPTSRQLKWRHPLVNGLGEDRPGTAGWAYQCYAGTVLRLVQFGAQQNWGQVETYKALMKPTNIGGLWLRRQKDPEAAFAEMWAKVDHDLLPWLPARERHERIWDATKNGITSQKGIIKFVGHANEGDVRADLRKLAAYGAIRIDAEQHGRVTWYRITVAVARQMFWDLSTELRIATYRKLARVESLRRRIKLKLRGAKVFPSGNTGSGSDEAVRAQMAATASAEAEDEAQMRDRETLNILGWQQDDGLSFEDEGKKIFKQPDHVLDAVLNGLGEPEAMPRLWRGNAPRQPMPGLPGAEGCIAPLLVLQSGTSHGIQDLSLATLVESGDQIAAFLSRLWDDV